MHVKWMERTRTIICSYNSDHMRPPPLHAYFSNSRGSLRSYKFRADDHFAFDLEIAVELPSVELPFVELPSVELPSVELPSVELPLVESFGSTTLQLGPNP